MAAPAAAPITATIRAVVGYVSRNPSASDTPEGIARWWLDDDTVPIELVKRALDWMTQRGLLDVVTAADGRSRYRRIASDMALAAALDADAALWDDGGADGGH